MEWLQCSLGSELWTYHHDKFFYMKVHRGMHPSSWIEVPHEDIEVAYDRDFPEFEMLPPFPDTVRKFEIPRE